MPLVPPGRLAALLISRRVERGLDVVALSRSSRGAFSPSYLDAVERGAIDLDDQSLRAIIDLYELESGPIVPDRSRLLLDLDRGLVGVGDTALSLPSTTGRDVLERYVSLLYLLRGETPGKKLTLRDEDLEVLGHSLGSDQQALADQLFALMGERETEKRTSLLGKRTAVLGAGLLVGATAMGALVIVSAGDSTDPVDSMSVAKSTLVSGTSGNSGASATLASSPTQPGVNQISMTPVSVRGVRVVAEVGNTTTDAADAAIAVTEDVEVEPPSDEFPAESDEAPTPLPTAQPTAAPAVAATPVATAVPAPTVAPVTAVPTAFATAVPVVSAPTSSAATPAQIGAAAETLVSYDFRSVLPGWSISYAGDSGRYHGLTNSHHKTIVVYVEASDSPASVAEVLMHEVGHAIDLEYLTDSTRRSWIELRNMPSVWWAGDGLSDFAVGSGDFAEAVAAVTTGSTSNSVYGSFTAEQLSFARAQLP